MQKREAIEEYQKTWGGDGHTIIKAESLVDMGFDFDFVSRFAYDHQSGKHYKEQIFDNKTGQKMDSCYGVYSLDFAYAIARDIKADTKEAVSKMGRGFQASCLYKATKERLDTLIDVANHETGKIEMLTPEELADENHPIWQE